MSQGDPSHETEGCPSVSTFQCDHCDGLFCCYCHRRSTCDPDDAQVNTIGHYCCESLACLQANEVATGASVDRTMARHARRRRAHPGRLVTTAQLDQLSLLGSTEESRRQARAALDQSTPPWRRLDALDCCAHILGIDGEARGPIHVHTRHGDHAATDTSETPIGVTWSGRLMTASEPPRLGEDGQVEMILTPEELAMVSRDREETQTREADLRALREILPRALSIGERRAIEEMIHRRGGPAVVTCRCGGRVAMPDLGECSDCYSRGYGK